MDEFEVPAIPKIFVAQPIPISSESQSSSNSSKSTTKPSNRDSSERIIPSSHEDPKKDKPSPPQLCASCSQILLSYFMPLQQYVNEVVQIARGDQDVTPRPLFSLLNTEVMKSKFENSSSDQRNEGNYSEDHHNRPSGDSHNVSNNNKNTSSHYSGNQSNVGPNRHQNQNFNQNSNQSHNSNENQSSNQNQNYSQNQNFTQTENYSQNENDIQNNYDSQSGQQSGDTIPESNQTATSGEHNSGHTTDNTQNYQNSSDQNVSEDKKTGYQENNDSNSSRTVVHISNEQTSHESEGQSQPESESAVGNESNSGAISSPFAFVTNAYNNLSATNAIILANSLLLTNNKTMNTIDKNGNKSTIQIPFVILIGGNIDPVLKNAIYMLFDEVISQPMDVRVALLSDQSFGIRQFKLQLWKELQNYQKCIYLESSTLVVGRITNLFEECQELSACVDWLFPDTFNCSVFVFEPSFTTYEQIISFAIFHQKCSAQKDEGVSETLDEMTLLNQFFAPKWNRISFVYNFVKNDAIYTQIPAFMKYGDSIRIVNFGHMMSQTGMLGNQPGMSSVQPWHISFDLLASSQQDVIKSMPIDNYSKFYLNCFVQRLWPIIQTHLTPLLVTKYGVGRREWSIFDLIRLLTNESGIETDDHMFTQTPITFRRIKSTAEKIAKYDSLSIDDEDDYITEQMPILSIDDKFEERTDNQKNQKTEESIDKNGKTDTTQPEHSEPRLTERQQDERSKSEWEAGRIDWMGAHQSDRIINRLRKLIRND